MDESNSLSNIEKQSYEKVVKKGEIFKDPEFLPIQESIGFTPEPEIERELPKFLKDRLKVKPKPKVFEWKRLMEVETNLNLNRDFPDNEFIKDVVQGNLGDCYFLSALSAFAEFKERIFALFKVNDVSKIGCYEVTGYIHGKECKILLDDYFPYTEDNGQYKLAFSSINPISNNIWPLMLEKAWAKVNRNYNNIIEGNAAQAFGFLSAAPIEVHFHTEDHSQLFDIIKKADDRRYIICSDISDRPANSTSNAILNSLGLISNHAYSVISILEVETKTGEIEKLLRIRNPWGGHEWTGDWSDKSEKWTPELKKKYKIEDKDDGAFYMNFKDYLRFYSLTYICKYHDGYNYFSRKFFYDSQNFFNLYSIDFKEKGHGYLMFNLKNAKIYKNFKKKESFTNKFANFTVYRKEGDQLIFIGTTAGRVDRVHVEVDIIPGTYIVCITFPLETNNLVADFNQFKYVMESSRKISYRLGLYTDLKKLEMDFKPVDPSQYDLNLFNLAFGLAQNNTELKEIFYQEGEPDTWRCMDYNESIESYGYLAYNNNSNAIIKERLQFTTFVNIHMLDLLNTHKKYKNINIEEEEEIIEDEYENEIFKLLDHERKMDSTCRILRRNENSKEVTESNPVTLEIQIAPHSKGVILFEKFDEFASLKATSQINMRYPINYVLSEKKFTGKKQRIKYKNEMINIFENVIKYPTGVVFKYKNKTKEFKIEIKIKFESLTNLEISKEFDSVYENLTRIYRKLDKRKDIDKTPNIVEIENENVIKITLYPKHCGFVELRSLNEFEDYSFKTTIDYQIGISEYYFSNFSEI